MALPEYRAAGFTFLFTGIEALMRAQDPFYASLPRVPMEVVGPSTVDLGDGRSVTADPIEVSYSVALDIPEAIAGRHEQFLAAMDATAANQLRQVLGGFFAHVNAVCEATGNTTQATLSWDAIIDSFERAEVSFDEDGNHGMQIVAGPGAWARLVRHGPPTAKQLTRWNAVMTRKQEEFNARRRRRSVPRNGH